MVRPFLGAQDGDCSQPLRRVVGVEVVKVIYKITYPNGKIYIGKDLTDALNYDAGRSLWRIRLQSKVPYAILEFDVRTGLAKGNIVSVKPDSNIVLEATARRYSGESQSSLTSGKQLGDIGGPLATYRRTIYPKCIWTS